MNSKALFDINCKLVVETDRAVKITSDELTFVWLPKSQIEIEPRTDGTVDITMPQWLAEEKKLV